MGVLMDKVNILMINYAPYSFAPNKLYNDIIYTTYKMNYNKLYTPAQRTLICETDGVDVTVIWVYNFESLAQKVTGLRPDVIFLDTTLYRKIDPQFIDDIILPLNVPIIKM